jgi:hypothetical protein
MRQDAEEEIVCRLSREIPQEITEAQDTRASVGISKRIADLNCSVRGEHFMFDTGSPEQTPGLREMLPKIVMLYFANEPRELLQFSKVQLHCRRSNDLSRL